MLFFDYLKNLDSNINFLKKRINDDHTLFLVGWCVRDPLLGITKKPTDIDFTMAGSPKHLDAILDKRGMSHFMTEKYGTITLLKDPIKYELTPLRTEGKYDDFRHPEDITRSDNLLLDSKRRDFTINCMYYTTTPFIADYTSSLDKKYPHAYTDDEWLLKTLDDYGYIYIEDFALLIIQAHKHIEKSFSLWMIHPDHLASILKSAPILSLGWKKKIGSEKPKSLRILIDPHQGIHDSINRKLRAVGDPDKRFNEDALRIIRAIRFVNVLNEKLKVLKISTLKNCKKIKLFDFEKPTWNSVKSNHALVSNVAKERVKDEIMKAFTDGDPFGFIALLDEAKLLEHIFPALYATKYVEQPIRYHPFDVYTHTMLTLRELQKINKDPLVRFAMLYHDVGKLEQFAAYGDHLTKEQIRGIIAGPLNHRRSSPEHAKRDFKALGFSSKEIADIARYIAHHHTPEEMLMTKQENTEKKVRSFLSEAGYKKAMNIFDITMADRLGQFNPLQNSSDLSDIDTLRSILKKLQKQEWQFTMKNLAINGWDLVQHFKLIPSALIWVLLKKTLDRVINDIKTRNTKTQIYGFLRIQLKHIKK